MIGLLLYFNLHRILNKAILFVMQYSYWYFCSSGWPEYNFDHSWFNIVDLQTLESSSCWITNLHNILIEKCCDIVLYYTSWPTI